MGSSTLFTSNSVGTTTLTAGTGLFQMTGESANLISSGSGFYPAGHFVNAKMSMAVVFPRPDSDTGAFGTTIAPHRLAFYDGTNSVPYQTPVAVQGGARPLVWSVVAGPAGMTVGGAYGAADYGIVQWTPSSSISTASPTTVTIRATDQQFNTCDVTWTLATSSSTTDFLFVNSSTGNDTTGNGTYGNPYASLSKVMGINAASTTFPGRRVYLSGSFQWPTQTGATGPGGGSGSGYFTVDKTKIPVVYRALPGATVSIDATLSQLSDNGGSSTDLTFCGSYTSRLSINGSASAPTDTHTFELYNAERCTWWNVDFVNPINRTNGSNTNSTSIFTSNSGIIKNYYLILGCTETGRSGAPTNSMLMTSMFSVQNVVFERNTCAGQCGFGVYFKDSNRNITAAYNRIDLQPNTTSSGGALLFGCQQNNQTAGNLEACYNFVTGGALKMDFQGGTGAFSQYSYRNTFYRLDNNEQYGVGQIGGLGPYTSDNDVVVSQGPGFIGTGVTATGTEVHKAIGGSPPPTDNPINITTGALVNATTAWRTLYLGTRGWEIA